MSAVLAVTGPIFALIGLGYVVTRIGLFEPATCGRSAATW